MYYAAKEQHIAWLKEKLAAEEAELAKLEERIIELQGSITYYRQAIEQLSPKQAIEQLSSLASNADSPFSGYSPQRKDELSEQAVDSETRTLRNLLPEGNKEPVESDDIEEENDIGLDFEEEEGGKRSPKDMLRPEYQGKTLGEIALEWLIKAGGRPLSPDTIAERIFVTSSDEELQRARNSLATELRRGAKEGRWKKVGRGIFSANPYFS